jgi:glycosyltransferase involved in cell wall biosynthesis
MMNEREGSRVGLSIVIPVYNEVKTLQEVVRRVRSVDLPLSREIILVDDASHDGSRAIVESLAGDGVRVFFHAVNQGKGAALRTGFKEAQGDIVLIQDADLEYDPSEYPKLLTPILADKADVVYGSRFIGSEAHRVLYFWHMVGNRFLTLLSNMLTNLNLTDMETCYKVFRRQVLAGIVIREDRFGFEPEITAKVARQGVRIYEVGISYSGRTYQEGKKIGWRDGMRALYCIVRYRFFAD